MKNKVLKLSREKSSFISGLSQISKYIIGDRIGPHGDASELKVL